MPYLGTLVQLSSILPDHTSESKNGSNYNSYVIIKSVIAFVELHVCGFSDQTTARGLDFLSNR